MIKEERCDVGELKALKWQTEYFISGVIPFQAGRKAGR